MSKFCIKDTTTMDILASNLNAEEAAEVFNFYEETYGSGSVFISTIPYAKEHDYKQEFISYFAELQEMGNLI